ncbi:conserved hypothetical protein [Paecilomyces variotii No. 5]|uniref:Phosphatidylcholine-sterol O-acyltransferase-like protein n=1 Tax=Byssochlamys spectabilis (strain No. 5 / NBRC 109023) TaxID=1356009 RepID=V5G4K5_BYSSN|nr:conserved hypothetical protein [Paecilomyces variotii No. 5]
MAATNARADGVIKVPGAIESGMLDVSASDSEANGLSRTGAEMSEPTTSSETEDDPLKLVDSAEEDEADDVIGVSISRAQSRMKARSTPAEEKARVMNQGSSYFDTVPDEATEPDYLRTITTEPDALDARQASNEEDEREAAEARTAGLKDGKEPSRSLFTRSILKGGLPMRPRAWTGEGMANIKLRKFLPDFNSLTKRSSLSSLISGPGHGRSRSLSTKLANARSEPPKQKQPIEDSPQVDQQRPYTSGNYTNTVGEEPISELRPLNTSTTARHSYQQRPSIATSGPPLALRRSASDQSIYLRSLSRTSSLEDRSRYEHVHSQINVRFKAIKDSLQDSSSRLLSMPGLNFHDMKSDWGYGRFVNDVHQRRLDQSAPAVDGTREKFDPQFKTRSNKREEALYPVLTEATSMLTGDVVILGGYRGSVLRSAKPPHRQLWVPMKVGLNIRKVDLEVGLTAEDEEKMEEKIIASGVLSHIGPVDICRRLINKLRKSDNARNGELRVWDYGYDWRLSPHLLSRKLIEFLEKLPSNGPDTPPEKRGAYVIAHSLGGLITRHAVNQRPDLFAGVVYAGVPQHCVNILGPLRNGDEVLLSSRVLTAQVNFTFRTSYALLPEDGRCFINKKTKEEYIVDFFNDDTWDEYRLSPCIATPLPPLGSNDSRRSLMDIPSSLPSLPKVGKRFSTVLGGKDGATEDSSAPKTGREQEQERHVPRNGDESKRMSEPRHASTEPITATAPAMQGAVGPTSNPRTTTTAGMVTTIPKHEAVAYLRRTLTEVRQFKQELAFNPSHQKENRYPPFAVLFGKSVPTVYGAKVTSREQMKHQDAYDDLAYAAGDGVCLASAAMLPQGYRIIRDGLVKSERGHVGLLGDLEGTGQCLLAIAKGRRAGVGLGRPQNVSGDPALA